MRGRLSTRLTGDLDRSADDLIGDFAGLGTACFLRAKFTSRRQVRLNATTSQRLATGGFELWLGPGAWGLACSCVTMIETHA